MKYDIFNKNWCELDWTEWMPSKNYKETSKIPPKNPGFYRVKADKYKHLIYIGQTGRNLRDRLRFLVQNTYKKDMPYTDPHTAAPNLWVYRIENKFEYEVSVFSKDLDYPNRQAFEDMLLWIHRTISSESTLCNYGRFHPRYIKSRSSSTGFRGRKLEEEEPDNPAGGPSIKMF